MYDEAIAQYHHVCAFMHDLSLVGQETFPGATPSHSLSMPMIMLNVICELRCYSGDAHFEQAQASRCLAEIKLHVHAERQAVLETVRSDGRLIVTLMVLSPGRVDLRVSI